MMDEILVRQTDKDRSGQVTHSFDLMLDLTLETTAGNGVILNLSTEDEFGNERILEVHLHSEALEALKK